MPELVDGQVCDCPDTYPCGCGTHDAAMDVIHWLGAHWDIDCAYNKRRFAPILEIVDAVAGNHDELQAIVEAAIELCRAEEEWDRAYDPLPDEDRVPKGKAYVQGSAPATLDYESGRRYSTSARLDYYAAKDALTDLVTSYRQARGEEVPERPPWRHPTQTDAYIRALAGPPGRGRHVYKDLSIGEFPDID